MDAQLSSSLTNGLPWLCVALQKAAFKMEQAGKAGDLHAMALGFPNLEQQFHLVREAMRSMK